MRLFIWRLMDNKRYFLRRIRIWFRNITLFSSNNAQTIFVIHLYMAIPEIKGSVFMMVRPNALGIGAASFAREAIAERAKI